jgi:hypothetical protein
MPSCECLWLNLDISEVDVVRFANALNTTPQHVERAFERHLRKDLPEDFVCALSQIASANDAVHMCSSRSDYTRDMHYATIIRAAGFFRKTEVKVSATVAA